jgi:hypothetical protein
MNGRAYGGPSLELRLSKPGREPKQARSEGRRPRIEGMDPDPKTVRAAGSDAV